MKAAAQCNIGACRTVNQDAVFACDENIGILPDLYIVADGMGGHAAGEHASAETVNYCVRFAQEATPAPYGDLLIEMAQGANRYIFDLAEKNPSWHGMGTTLVAAIVDDANIYCVNVGDSRLYILNQENELQKVTVDHSVVEMMVMQGELTEEEARLHPNRNYITRAIGTEISVQADLYQIPRTEAKMLLLCSDGLSSQVPLIRMSEIVTMRTTLLEDRSEMLVNEANRNGGADNISLILVDLEGGTD